jgi:hypothetical protein
VNEEEYAQLNDAVSQRMYYVVVEIVASEREKKPSLVEALCTRQVESEALHPPTNELCHQQKQ